MESEKVTKLISADYSADDLAQLEEGSIVTTRDEMVVAIKITDTVWAVSGYAQVVPDHKMGEISTQWPNVRTIFHKKEGQH